MAWAGLADQLANATRAMVPALPLQPHKPWVSRAALALVQQRRELFTKARRSGGGISGRNKRKLKRLRHRIQRQLQKDKRANAAAVAARMQADFDAGNLHAFYNTMQRLGADRPAQRSELSGPNGEPLHSSSQQAAAFATHFEGVLHCGREVPQEVLSSAAAQPWAAQPDSDMWQLPTEADTGAAVQGLKHWRAADPDGLWAEQVQAAWEESPAFRWHLHQVVLAALQHGVPAAAKQAEGLPLFKGGDASDPGNYRCIQLISMLRKILALLISRQLRTLGERRLLEYQCGFRPQRGCCDQLFSLRRLCELSVAQQQRLYAAFVDLRKAFDSVNRDALWVVLLASGVPEELVRILADLHQDSTCRIRVGVSRSRPFSMEWGVQQGCPLAPFLFNLFMDWVVREALAACPGSGVSLRYSFPARGDLPAPARMAGQAFELRLPLLMLADDIAVLASSAEGLEQFLLALETACQRWGLTISPTKTELMLVGGASGTACEGCQRLQPEGNLLLCDSCDAGWHTGCLDTPLRAVPEGQWLCPACDSAATTAASQRTPSHHHSSSAGAAAAPPTSSPQPPTPPPTSPHAGTAKSKSKWRPDITIGDVVLPWSDQFKYLGAKFAATSELDGELSYRIGNAAAVFRRLQRPFFAQRTIGLGTKMIVLCVLVLSVMLYGCESWALTDAQLERLEVVYRGWLRQILGVRRRDGVSNEALLGRCKPAESITVHVARRQLNWLGHMGRMDNSRLAKQLLWATLPEGRRRRGRPNPSLPNVYAARLEHIQPLLDEARTQYQARMMIEGGSLHGFSWLVECADRAAWRKLIGYKDVDRDTKQQ